MSLQQLYHNLLSINSDKKTGKIYVYVRENRSRRTGVILVGSGEIIGINYFQRTGGSAFAYLLSLGVEEVVFMPRSDVENYNKEADAPPMLIVLKILKDKLLALGVLKQTDLRQEVRQEVELLLKKIYGPGIVKEINKIDDAFPFSQNPSQFLDQCKGKALLMLNKDQVEVMFEPLYKKIS